MQAVFGIYRYDTGIWPFFDYFWTGMVYWYAKVVSDQFDFFLLGGVNMSSKPLCHWSPSHDSLPTRAIGSLATYPLALPHCSAEAPSDAV